MVPTGSMRPVRGLVEAQGDRSGQRVLSLGASGKLVLDAVHEGREEGGNPRSPLAVRPMLHHLGAQAKCAEIFHAKHGQVEDDGIHWRQSLTLTVEAGESRVGLSSRALAAVACTASRPWAPRQDPGSPAAASTTEAWRWRSGTVQYPYTGHDVRS